MMKTSNTAPSETSLGQDLRHALRYYLGGRRGVIVLAVVVLAAGAALNWGWLVAIGIAPVLLTLLPCAAMCALGLCMNKMKYFRRLGWGVVCALGLAALIPPLSAQTLGLDQLRQQTHFHGLAVDRQEPTRLLLATHHGFFAVSPDGQATLLSDNRNDYMGFTPHPSEASTLYASGHPAGGGNLGFIASTDGGKTWSQLSPGVNGPVDFHQMDASQANPQVIYGAYRGLQVSKDGGHRWVMVGPLPDRLIDLAASAQAVDRLYAATEKGLRVSEDGGRSWQQAHPSAQPATLVQATPAGEVYAFVIGSGLLKATEPSLDWTVLSADWGERYVLHLAVDPTDPAKLYAVTREQEILASQDGGRTWAAFGGQ